MGRSALGFASQHGHSEIAAVLADSGAQLNLKTHVCILKSILLFISSLYFEALFFHCVYEIPTTIFSKQLFCVLPSFAVLIF